MRGSLFHPLLCFVAAWLSASSAIAQDEPTIEELWKKSKSGDEAAYEKLIELGPETRELADRILRPEGEVFHQWPEDWEGSRLLSAMEADAAPAIIRAIDNNTAENTAGILEFLAQKNLPSERRMARPAADAIMNIALRHTGKARDAAFRALATAQIKKDFVVPTAIAFLKRTGTTRSDSSYRAAGANRIAQFGAELLKLCPDKRASEPLLDAAQFHPSRPVRRAAIEALAATDRDNERTIVRFIDQLDDDDSPASTAIDLLLKYHELPAKVATPLIRKLYRDSFEGQYLHANDLCEVICRCQTTDEEAQQLVTRKLRPLLRPDAYFHENTDPRKMRIAIASVVLKWNPNDREAAEFLIAEIGKSPDRDDFTGPKATRYPDVRAHAAAGLGRIGPAAKPWLPILQTALKTEVEKQYTTELGFDLAWAIAQIDPEDEKCLQILKKSEYEFRLYRKIPFAEIQRILGDRARSLIDIEQVRIRLHDPKIIQHLYLFESDDGDWFFFDEDWLWVRLRFHVDAIVPILLMHTKSEITAVRRKAITALTKLHPGPELVVPVLATLLGDRRATVRAAAADALAAFGRDAGTAIPALTRARKDKYLTVQIAAEDALLAVQATPDNHTD